MAEFNPVQAIIRLANAAMPALDGADEELAEDVWEELQSLPLEIRLALSPPIRTDAEWTEIFDAAIENNITVTDEVTSDIYHVEPS